MAFDWTSFFSNPILDNLYKNNSACTELVDTLQTESDNTIITIAAFYSIEATARQRPKYSMGLMFLSPPLFSISFINVLQLLKQGQKSLEFHLLELRTSYPRSFCHFT